MSTAATPTWCSACTFATTPRSTPATMRRVDVKERMARNHTPRMQKRTHGSKVPRALAARSVLRLLILLRGVRPRGAVLPLQQLRRLRVVDDLALLRVVHERLAAELG